MTKYYANIMKTGYKSELIELQAKSLPEALTQSHELANVMKDCIGYSTAIKVPGCKLQYV